MVTVLSSYSSNLNHALWKCSNQKPFKFRERSFCKYLFHEQNSSFFLFHDRKSLNNYTRYATTKGSKTSNQSDEEIPTWAKPGSDEPPPWARDGGNSVSEKTMEIPFYVYLIASALTAIAAIGSIFEYANGKPVFGVLGSDSVFYTPLLGFFALTGIPTSAFLWFKSVQVANKAAEEQDRRDGFL